ncbi:large conductance mechanosensitive channel protein MscL [Orrella marina]|uniref:Large-conductance mechanosensitive channel n=1 Tax=Orrella marina TaxID=2163011 RepID=A0A2R4XM56_9BURK|nr:large conductance mechanosensitive channel protein MscL [Orrella marina]AWB34886.1 large conductance mechanosensitive channel protein MscL [Orrella marina]
MSTKKGILKEFRDFAVRGNVIDLAVGVIIGAAFGKIVDSLVRHIVMPIVNFIMGGSVDFTNKFLVLSRPDGYAGPETYSDLTTAGAIVFAWGEFLTILINFVILAFIIFWMVKLVNMAKDRAKAEEAAQPAPPPPAPPADIVLLTEIRDLLKQQETTAASQKLSGSDAGSSSRP